MLPISKEAISLFEPLIQFSHEISKEIYENYITYYILSYKMKPKYILDAIYCISNGFTFMISKVTFAGITYSYSK